MLHKQDIIRKGISMIALPRPSLIANGQPFCALRILDETEVSRSCVHLLMQHAY